MIWDCTFYAGEADMLRAHVEHLEGLVDRHVVIEGTHTFTGMPRAITSLDIPAGAYHHIVEFAENGRPRAAWAREHDQRNQCLPALKKYGAKRDDMVLLCDVDEFPSRDVFDYAYPIAARTQSFVYCLNGLQANGVGHSFVYVPFGMLESMSPQVVRDERYRFRDHGGKELNAAGWHFTYQGGADAIRRKIQMFSHQELNTPAIIAPGFVESRIASGLWLTDPPDSKPTIQYVALEEYVPPAIEALAQRRPDMVHAMEVPA